MKKLFVTMFALLAVVAASAQSEVIAKFNDASSWLEAWNSACLSRCPRGEWPLVELYLGPGADSFVPRRYPC